jgi:serine/threonine-protein kinase
VRIVMQLCDALTAVHAAKIVHRDLKPENLFLIERQGVPDFVKVLDFGVCKLTQAHDGSFHRLTGTGAALGTPHFMAPEQIEGRADVDHRADLYAVGGILFNALTGDAPFDAPSLPRLFMRICNDPPPRLRELRPDAPEALEEVVTRALAKDPSERYASSQELKRALAPFADLPAADGEPAERAPQRSFTRMRAQLPAANVTDVEWVTLEARRRWPLRAVLVGLLVLVAAAGAGLWHVQRGTAPDARRATPARATRATPDALTRPAAEAPRAQAVPPANVAPVVSQGVQGGEATRATGATGPARAERDRPARGKSAAERESAAPEVKVAEPPVQPAQALPAAVPGPSAPDRPAADPLLPQRELKHVF